MSDTLATTSMQILIHAGEGRAATFTAIDAVGVGDAERCAAAIGEAEQALKAAHRLHTERIQAEAGGEASEYSMLFAHAQDTLMTAYGELRLMKRLLPVVQRLDERIAALEARR